MTDDLAVARREPLRIEYLDGLRGLGALSVVLCHFFGMLIALLGPQEIRATAWANWGPALLLTNGPFYVKVFFTLSGYVLASSVASGRTVLAASVITRYLRLTVPMLAALLFTWLLGLWLPHPAAAALLPNFGSVLSTGLWGVYLHGGPLANFALWTMQLELLGSLAIYVVYKLPLRFRNLALVLFTALCLFHPNVLGFAFGAVLRELHHAGRLHRSRWVWVAGLAYVYFCCQGNLGLADASGTSATLYRAALFYTLGASGLIYLLITVPFWQRFLKTWPCQFLAHLSFGLYLLHMPLINPMARLYPLLAGPLVFRLLVLFLLYVSLSLLCGWLLTVLIDDPLIRLLKYWRKGALSRLTFFPLINRQLQ